MNNKLLILIQNETLFGSVTDTIILLIIKTQELFEREMPTAHQNQFN